MKCIPIFFILIFLHVNTHAQDNDAINSNTSSATNRKKLHQARTATLSFFNHSISLPFHKIINPTLHPGVQVGIEARYFETQKSKLYQAFNLGMFYNSYNGTGFYLNTELGYRYTTNWRISPEAFAGLGYLNTYHPSEIYSLSSSGTYELVKDNGFSSAIVSFGFGLGYAIKSSSRFSFAPFLRYACLVQTHYSEDLDVLPHATFHFGIRINKLRSK